jgi:hypothetical protein
MTPGQKRTVVGATMAFAVVVLAGMFLTSPRGKADDGDDRDDEKDPRIHQGFEIAPVPLNLEGKNRALVGLGSYFVNAQMDCDGCHSAGPRTEFAMGGNPYFGQKKKVNPATYLGWRTRFRRVSTAARYWFRAHHLSQFNADAQDRVAGRGSHV